jgi:hypothetical protein
VAAVSQRSKSFGSMINGMRLWIVAAISFGSAMMIV